MRGHIDIAAVMGKSRCVDFNDSNVTAAFSRANVPGPLASCTGPSP